MKKIYTYSKSRLCFECAHYYCNNRDLKKDGFKGNRVACRAYPDEIPYGYPEDGHVKVQDNQIGNFVFEQVDPKLVDIIEKDESIEDARFEEFGHY